MKINEIGDKWLEWYAETLMKNAGIFFLVFVLTVLGLSLWGLWVMATTPAPAVEDVIYMTDEAFMHKEFTRPEPGAYLLWSSDCKRIVECPPCPTN